MPLLLYSKFGVFSNPDGTFIPQVFTPQSMMPIGYCPFNWVFPGNSSKVTVCADISTARVFK